MSDDWKVGDLALCVSVMPCALCGFAELGTEIGKIYRVEAVQNEELLGGYWLLLPEAKLVLHEHFNDDLWFASEDFRKIRPDEHEPCEDEFVTLLNRTKVPAKARGLTMEQADGGGA